MGGIIVKASIDFKSLLDDIVAERQVEGIDEKNKLISFEKITKAITNMIIVNPKMKKALIEVKINGK